MSAAVWTFRFLGGFDLFRDGVPEVLPLRSKTMALLAYLAHMSRAQRRQALAELFCSEASDQAASLRWYLSRLRKALGKESIHSEGGAITLRWNRGESDATYFASKLGGDVDSLSDQALEDLLALYRGEFLAGIEIKNAPHFSLWLTGERGRFAMLYEEGMQAWIQRLVGRGEHHAAIQAAQRFLESDPLREEVHSLLMWLYARQGQRDAAVRQYQLCQKLRKTHLDVPLLDETEDLYQQICEGDFTPRWEDMWAAPAAAPAGAGLVVEALRAKPVEQSQNTMLVERETELETLSTLWSVAKSGQCTVAWVESDAGGGKTALLEAWRETCDDAFVLVGRGFASEEALPYQLWCGLLRQLLARTKQAAWWTRFVREQFVVLLPEMADAWSLPRSGEMPAAGAALTLFYAAWQALLSAVASESPLLLILEDLQWADSASLSLLRYLAHTLKELPVCFVGSMRSDEGAENRAARACRQALLRECDARLLTLAPLSEEGLCTLIDVYQPSWRNEERASVLSALLEKSRGNPWFAIELLRHVRIEETGEVVWQVSPSIRALVEHRLETIPARFRQIFEACAVLGGFSSLPCLVRTSALSSADVCQAVELGLETGWLSVVEDGEVRLFPLSQPLLGEALLAALSPLRYDLLHERAADSLEEAYPAVRPVSAVIAHHRREAKQPDREREALRRAVEESLSCRAYGQASVHLQRCLVLTKKAEEQWPLLLRQAKLKQWQGCWSQAQEALDVAGSLAVKLGPHERIETLFAFGRLAMARQQAKVALRYFKQAHRLVTKQRDEDVVCRSWLLQAQALRVLKRWKASLGAYEQALDLATALAHNEWRSEAHGGMAAIYLQRGQLEAAASHVEHTIQIGLDEEELLQHEEEHALSLEDQGQFTLSKMMGTVGFWTDRRDVYLDAISYFEEQLSWVEPESMTSSMRRGVQRLSALSLWQGDFERALFWTHRQFAWATQHCSFPGLSKAVGQMAEIYRATGAWASAEACYRYRLHIALDLKVPRDIALSLARIVDVYRMRRWATKLEAKHVAPEHHDETDDSLLERCLDLAKSLCRTHALVAEESEVMSILAQWHQDLEQRKAALQVLREAVALGEASSLEDSVQHIRTRLLVAEATNQRDQLVIALDALRGQLDEATQPKELAFLHETLAGLYVLAGEPKRGTTHRRAAIKQYRTCYQQARRIDFRLHALAMGARRFPAHHPPKIAAPPQIMQYQDSLSTLLQRCGAVEAALTAQV